MANQGTPSSKQLALGDHSGLGRIYVDIEAFFELSFWIAEEIEDLVGVWQQRLPRRAERQPLQAGSRQSQTRRAK